MSKAYQISDQNGKEIRESMKTVKNKNFYRRLEVIALRSEGKSNAEIAEITKYHPKRVSQLVSQYCNEGIETLMSDGRKGGNDTNLLSRSPRNNKLFSVIEQTENLNISWFIYSIYCWTEPIVSTSILKSQVHIICCQFRLLL